MKAFSSRKGAGLRALAPLLFMFLESQAQAAKCISLPLSIALSDADSELASLLVALADYESAFANEDGKIYHQLVHPSKHQTLYQSKAQFETVFPSYGLSKPSLNRAKVYELRFSSADKSVEVECDAGKARGVVGPERQFMVQHTAFSKNEQMRVTTIFAPIPKAVKALNKTKYELGIVMFHTQSWSHEGKTPVGLLEEARKWNLLKSPITAYVFAESARRILDSNPYFSPKEIKEASSLSTELKQFLPNIVSVNKAMEGNVQTWEYLGLTLVYQGYGVEPAFYFRMKKDEELNRNLDKCRASVAAVATFAKELRNRFHGVECIPFAPGEDLNKAPKGGTMFVPWSEMKQK